VFVTYDVWYKNIFGQSQYFTDLSISNERVIVVPFDEQGLTGQAVHLATVTGVEKGLGKFTSECMSNYRIGQKADGSMVIENGDGIAAVTRL
jgi:hypothetical protein